MSFLLVKGKVVIWVIWVDWLGVGGIEGWLEVIFWLAGHSP